jgi:hypothetical protein
VYLHHGEPLWVIVMGEDSGVGHCDGRGLGSSVSLWVIVMGEDSGVGHCDGRGLRSMGEDSGVCHCDGRELGSSVSLWVIVMGEDCVAWERIRECVIVTIEDWAAVCRGSL